MKLPKYVIPITAVGAAVGLGVLFKESVGGQRYVGKERMAGRTVIVTGATSGIGKETAKDLAHRGQISIIFINNAKPRANGGRVIMACRDMEKCAVVRDEIVKETFNTNVHCKKLNLASLKSIQEFARDINENEKRLDVLINNAGVMANKRSVTEDGFETNLGVNYLGAFSLTNLLVNKLAASAPSRVIMLTNVGYETAEIKFDDLNSERSYKSERAYKQSKLACVLFTRELAKRLQKRGVTVNAVSPGLVETNLRRELSMSKSWISGTVLKPLWFLFFKTPKQGAQTCIYCAVEPSIADHTGSLYSECKEAPLSANALNEETSTRLWLTSEKWTRLT